MTLGVRPFTHGLHEIGDRCYAWIQPDAERLAARKIDRLVNTHANPDHCNGNELVSGAEIIASRAAAAEMATQGPKQLAMLMRQAPGLGEAGRFLIESFSGFDFEGITQVLPTTTFEGRHRTRVGDKTVVLKQFGPCHSAGDILVHVPDDRIVFTTSAASRPFATIWSMSATRRRPVSTPA